MTVTIAATSARAVATATTRATRITEQTVAVLVFHKTAGYRHDSIQAGVEALTSLGAERGFTVTATDDAAVFSDAGLSAFDVVVFLSTTGDVLGPEQELAMQRFIEAGNGFVGIHAAADTEYDWPWYGGLVGAYFDSHPAPQPGRIRLQSTAHPITAGVSSEFTVTEEWYNFRSLPAPSVTILATLDETSYTGGTMGAVHPIVWAHEYGGGRSAYIAFGHAAEAFADPLIRPLLAQAVLWAGA